VYERGTLDALGRLARAHAIVIDVRDNGGGNTPWRLQKALAGTRHPDWITGPDHVQPSWWARAGLYLRARTAWVPRYRGRVVMLVNGGCASACEDLLVAVRGQPNVTIVGDSTFGSTGQPWNIDLGDGMRARIGARRARLPDGGAFEGVGIAPDVRVVPTAASIAAQQDPVLDRAVALLRGA
jgi:carboxyl-terminal processing protease